MVRGDNNSSDKEYYGVLTDIYELQYVGGNHVVVFKCDWWDVLHRGSAYKIDSFGFTSVNKNRTLKTTEPFVLASQVEQVYYIEEPKDSNWLTVLKAPPRDLYNIQSATVDKDDIEDEEEIYQQQACEESTNTEFSMEETIRTLQRPDLVGDTIPYEQAEEIQALINSTNNNEEFVDEYEDEENDDNDFVGSDFVDLDVDGNLD